MIIAGCIWIHQVRNTIWIRTQFIFMFFIEEIIDINEIFKNEIYENYLVHGWNTVVLKKAVLDLT